MSGFVAMVWGDTDTSHQQMLATMTSRLAYRGPHGQTTWTGQSAALGHTLLRTNPSRPHAAQPLTLDNQIWITADARIDDRERLIALLQRHDSSITQRASDEALILTAYSCFGPSCTQHLIGDFAFAVWDSTSRRLFAAVDRFAIRPLYYTWHGASLTASNCLDTVRIAAPASQKIDENALADFLILGFYSDPQASIFQQVRRLPPAHYLVFENGRAAVQRYWSPSPGQFELPTDNERVVERFQEVFGTAVADRLVSAPQALQLSGGLDSALIAATAVRLQNQHPAYGTLGGHTVVYDSLMPDDEGDFAKLVAGSLGLPIKLHRAVDFEILDWVDRQDWTPPEPLEMPGLGLGLQHYRELAAESSIVLTGHDGDTLLKASFGKHFYELFRQARYITLLRQLGWYGFRTHRLPILGWMRHDRKRSQSDSLPRIPAWLRPDWVARTKLLERWHESVPLPSTSPTRMRALTTLNHPYYSRTFDVYDPAYTGQPLEFRHPFMDVRVVEFLLALPAVPWCLNKELLRRALRSMVPEEVRLRPKTPLQGDPLVTQLFRRSERWFARPFHPALEEIIDRSRLPPFDATQTAQEIWSNLRPFALDAWWRKRLT